MPIAVYVPPYTPPNVPVIRPPAFVPMPSFSDYQWAYGDHDSRPSYVLGGERNSVAGRKATWRLTPDVSDAEFSIAGTQPAAAAINEGLSDLWVIRNGQALGRFRVGGSDVSGQADSPPQIQFKAADYRQVLESRMLFDSDSRVYTSMDQSAIAWALISQAQGLTGGDMRLIRGDGQTTGYVPSTQTYDAGTMIGDLINQLAQQSTGFDWDITPRVGTADQTFDVFYPLRGVERGKYLDFPGQINSYQRQTDATTFRNVIRATGSDGLSPVTVTAPTLGADGNPRMDGAYSDSDIQTMTALTGAANRQLALQQFVQPAWVVTLKPNVWGGPTDVWIGDPVTLSVNDGVYDVVETLRVIELGLSLDDETDAATVQLTLGAPNRDARWKARRLDKRLRSLEGR